MTKRVLLLIRHGQYDVVTEPGVEPDGPLTETGLEQTVLTAERLRALPVSKIYFSPAQRTRETAERLALQFPRAVLQAEPLLQECIPIIPAGMQASFAHVPAAFIERGAEAARQAFAHFVQPLNEGDPDCYEILVSHGNLIAHLVCQTLRAPLDAWYYAEIHHCGISEIHLGGHGRVAQRLIRHNDNGHLPYYLRTV